MENFLILPLDYSSHVMDNTESIEGEITQDWIGNGHVNSRISFPSESIFFF